MELRQSIIEEAICETEYSQACLESLLQVLQPTFYGLDIIIKVLLHGPDGAGKRMLARAAAKKLNMNFIEERVADLFDENIVGTEKKFRAAFSRISSSSPSVIYFTDYDLLCKLDNSDLLRIEWSIEDSLNELSLTENRQPVVFIAATTEFQLVFKTPLSNIFHQDIPIKPMTQSQTSAMLISIKKYLELSYDVAKLAKQCEKSERYLGNILDLIAHHEASDDGLASKDQENEEEIEDGTRWADIGGLSQVKREIIDAVQMSIDFPQLKQSGLRRTGILLYGPPGTGKTLLARAVATECDLNFINVKGPELLNEYVGQSEDNIRRLFQRAREASPAVIFFDELDSLAPNRGQAGDSGGVMDRLVSQILAEMDGVGKSGEIFVIGATNRVDLVDPSLLRPGRFDKVLEVPLPVSQQDRREILKALTNKMELEADVSEIEAMTPAGMSGADFQGLCSRAWQRAFDRCVEQIESGQETEDGVSILVNREDFIKSMQDE